MEFELQKILDDQLTNQNQGIDTSPISTSTERLPFEPKSGNK